MFKRRFLELLKIIDFDLWDCNNKGIIITDKRTPDDKRFYDYIELPCEYIADDESRKIECAMNENIEWAQVRSMNNDETHDNMKFFRACTQIDENNDYYAFGFEKDGSLYDIYVGQYDGHETYFCRELDIVGDETYLTEVEYKDGNLVVSKKHNNDFDTIMMSPSSPDEGTISFYKNGKSLDKISINGNLDDYYSSLLSIANNVVETNNQLINIISNDSYNRMIVEIPIFIRILKLQLNSYEADLIDEYLKKYQLFQENNNYNVK